MLPALICLAVVAVVLACYVAWLTRTIDRERRALLEDFKAERAIWARERTDLNNRIQVPQAAPYLAAEEDPEAAKDDLPTLPDFTIDEAELEEARKALERAGYEEGPVV